MRKSVKTDVFVSHAGDDLQIARAIIVEMRKRGLTVFSPEAATTNLEESVATRWENARSVVFLWSRAAAASSFAHQEISKAIEAWSSGRLTLVAIDETPLPIGLSDLPVTHLKAGDSKSIAAVVQQFQPTAKPVSDLVTLVVVGASLVGSSLFAYFDNPRVPSLPNVPDAPFGHELITLGASGNFLVFTGFVAFFATAVFCARVVWSLLKRLKTNRAKYDSERAWLNNPKLIGNVFVSYSHADEPAVAELVSEIERLGHHVWIDRRSIGASRYAEQIVGAISASRVVALMSSRNSLSSDDVVREINIAGYHKKPFVALKLDQTDFPAGILYFVVGHPWISITNMESTKLREELARAFAKPDNISRPPA